MSLDPITPAGRIVEQQLDTHLLEVQKEFGSVALAFVGPIYYGADDSIREAVEFVRAQGNSTVPVVCGKNKLPKISVILETGGGFAEVAERIANLLHDHFEQVEFVIPNRAMSAGTILVMSGNEIWMDYYSVLGPIDPQVESPKGGLMPAHGYLIQYNRLIEKSKKRTITTAELQFLIQTFDAAELYHYEQEMELSVTLLKQWLVKYKFKNWNKTETGKKKVTARGKLKCAADVAKSLNNTTRWHSHGRGISMEILKRDVGLKINDFGEKDCVNNPVRIYYKLLADYMVKLSTRAAVHVVGNFFPMRPSR